MLLEDGLVCEMMEPSLYFSFSYPILHPLLLVSLQVPYLELPDNAPSLSSYLARVPEFQDCIPKFHNQKQQHQNYIHAAGVLVGGRIADIVEERREGRGNVRNFEEQMPPKKVGRGDWAGW